MLKGFLERARTVLAIGGIVAITATACQAAGPSAAPNPQVQYADGGTVNLRLLADWTTFDPAFSNEQHSRLLMNGVYERLLAIGPKNEVVPYVAKSWETTPTTTTFTLRSDSKCADGTPVTPSVVASSFKRLFDPATKYYNLLAGYGPGPHSVVADDQAGTVKFTFGAAYGPRLYSFANDVIVCPAGIASAASTAALRDALQGSGPYVIESAVHNSKVVMNLRPDWKSGPAGTTGTTKGLPSKLIFNVVGNDTTVANLLLTGGMDISVVAGPDVPRLQADKSFGYQETANFVSTWAGFNQTPGLVFADPAVRAAFMHVFDPKAWN